MIIFRCLAMLLLLTAELRAQSIKRIDGSKISASQLTSSINTLMRKAHVSGVAISVFNEHKPVYVKTFGYADVPGKKPLTTSSVMYAASFAKMLFAYVAMQFVQEGKLDLDKPLVEYLSKPLPEYKISGWNRGYQDLINDDRYKLITARMCLTHTTGFPNWRWFEADKKLKFKFAPGTRYSYSGEGIYLLQWVIEQISTEDYETISRKRVFQPFGMNSTSHVWQDRFDSAVCFGHNAEGKPYELMKWKEASAGGSMSTTLDDFTRFYQKLISSTGLTAASFKEMTKTQVRIRSRSQFGPLSVVDSADNDAIALGYGLGVGVFNSPAGPVFFKEGHDEGWGHYSVCFPEKKIAIVIMTNNDNGESIFKELLETAIEDRYTPWRWENYIPYQL